MPRAPVSPIPPSAEAQALLLSFVEQVMTERQKFSHYFDKMEIIDKAYARYQEEKKDPYTGIVSGQGIDAATTPVGVTDLPSTVPPVLVSQVDSMLAYLSEVFLSGSPMFPIVSAPEDREEGEQLETLLDDHATIGGYARQLMLFMKDGIKYNFSALEADWSSIDQYSITSELLDPSQTNFKKDNKSYTKLTRRDPYNAIWDHNVAPGDVAAEGDYAGFVEILSRTKLKRLLTRWGNDGEAINIREALACGVGNKHYREHPTVSMYVPSRTPNTGIDWTSYIMGAQGGQQRSRYGEGSNNYELITLYARIVPKEFKLGGPSANTPQIWKLVIVNSQVVVQARRIVSAYDYLPMLFGQPLEDGLGYQTQSIAESNIPFQQAAATLFNIRFNSARRAVSDRALYDADLINPSDINAPVPAAKIPVRINRYNGDRPLSSAYHQIPFDSRGTETALQDGMTIVEFGKELSGLNSPMRGQFQPGNKSVTEWQDTMSGADARLRLPALCLEFQVFQPLKEMLKLNIFQYGDDAVVVSENTGKAYDVKIADLRSKVLRFKVADGYTPKSKLAGTDSLNNLMMMIAQSPILQQAYGSNLPAMFAHLASLMGVNNLKQYDPQNAATSQAQPPQQLPSPIGAEAAMGMDMASATQSMPQQGLPPEASPLTL